MNKVIPFPFFVVILLCVIGGVVFGQNPHPAPAVALPLSEKGQFNFHLIDLELFSFLTAYSEAHPEYKPVPNLDGTFPIPEGYDNQGKSLVLASYVKNESGKEEIARYIPLVKEPALSGLAVQDAAVQIDKNNHRPIIDLTLGDYVDQDGILQHGVEIFRRVTESNRGKYIAIVFQNRIISYAMIQDVILTGRVHIYGEFTAQEAEEIVSVLTGSDLRPTDK